MRKIIILLIIAITTSSFAATMREIKTSVPLTDQRGRVLANVPIIFTMVDKNGRPADCWPVVAGGRIAPIPVTAKTNAFGNFSTTLAVTSQCSQPRYYLSHVQSSYSGIADFIAPLDAATGSIEWIDFMAHGGILTAVGIDAFTRLAPTANEKAALDAANNPSAGNPIATLLDLAYQNIITSSTPTNLTGFLYGNGSTMTTAYAMPITSGINVVLSSPTGCSAGWQTALSSQITALTATGIDASNILCRDTSP